MLIVHRNVRLSPKLYSPVRSDVELSWKIMEMVSLLGKEVVELNGSLVGIVKNVIFDEKTWEVWMFDVLLDKNMADEFEAKKLFKNFRIPLEVSYVQGIGDKIMLKTTKDELMTSLATKEY
jgi:sporulation protein YlmC with PRC-barrel domain